MQQPIRRGVIVMIVVGVDACRCWPRAAGNRPLSRRQGGELQGTITASGAFALYPLMVKWGEEYQKLHPDVQFDISAGGAGKGMTDALGGQVDIGMVSRRSSRRKNSRAPTGCRSSRMRSSRPSMPRTRC